MSNAARRVLELFLQTPIEGVTGVTHVTERLAALKNPAVTPVTPVTCQTQRSGNRRVTDVTATPDMFAVDLEERAAIIEYDGGIPRSWAEALARLNPARPPCNIPPARWLQFIDDCGRFLDGGWATRAAVLGWGPLDLFGCDRERPFARVDHLGLLWLLNGGAVVELHRDQAILEAECGARQRYWRRPVEVGRVVLAWELSHEANVQ
jgi:hypothetical protein